jgi:hypothetical protein
VSPRPLLAPLAALALVLPAAALGQDLVPPAGGLADLTGSRTLALAGATGLASGNDGIFVNPGAIAARRRYSVDSLYALDRRGSTTVGNYIGASVVDALSSSVAFSASWMHPLRGYQEGNVFSLGVAGSIMERLYLGVQGRYHLLDVAPTVPGAAGESIDVVNVDAGLLWEVSDYISVGASGFNLVPSGHEETLPRSMGAGIAIGSDTGVRLVGDWRADFDRVKDAAGQPKTTNRYGVGLEAFLGNMVPLRAGYLIDETLDTTWWSAGIGLVTPTGVALDAGYRQSMENPDARIMSVSFKMQFLNM